MDFDVWHYSISGADSLFRTRIEDAFARFGYLINQPGLIFDASNGGVDVKKKNNNSFSKSQGGNAPAVPASVNVAAVIGASAAGLAFILLLILLVRRKNAEDEPSHLKLEEDIGADDTFIREFETASSSPSREGYETRNVHVVGEADSIYSGWTGYTHHEKGAEELGAHELGDVHKCSSATCEVCEQRRQQGIQFIPTGSPAIHQIPSDASREYVADDTVEL